MKFTELVVVKLLNTLYEDFTSFCITALSVAESDSDFDNVALTRIKWLIDNVHEDLQTSIYKLDRFIDPTKTSDDPTKYAYAIKVRSDLIVDDTGDSHKLLELKSENLQRYLCDAVQEINSLMYKHMSQYNEDFVMPKSTSSDTEGFE